VTTAEEARFIELWQQGLETATIAQRLGIPPGTARSRAYWELDTSIQVANGTVERDELL
jgi:DNA-directed RNA polymerase specialized sigma24 family protein